MSESTRPEQAMERRSAQRGPRCVGTGRVQMTDICADVHTLSQMMMLCERRFAEALAGGDVARAARWADAGHTVLAALRPNAPTP